tara:strand:- start:2877 stop:4013 length:1137 start_codon:yes stop_codon:yes gene_type:complete
MLHKLIRYKHGLIILLALLAPGFQVVSSLVLSPIRSVMVPNASLQYTFLSLVGLQALFVSWAAIQKPAIMGAPFRSYLQTLPVEPFRFLKTDLLLLLVANLILWVPFVFVFFEITNEAELARFCIVISGIIISQMLFLYGSYEKFIALIFSDLFFVLSAVVQDGRPSFFFAAMSCIMLFVSILPGSYFKFLSVKSFRVPFIKSLSLPLSLPFEVLVLTRHYTFPVMVRFSLLMLIAVLSSILLKYSALRFYYWGSIQFFVTVMTCFGSAYYALLHEGGIVFRTYLKTLPCSEFYWNVRECLVGAAPSMGVAVVLLCAQGVLSSLSFLHGVVAVMMQIPLLICLYSVRTRFLNQGTFLAFLISAVWAGFLMMCVDRGFL